MLPSLENLNDGQKLIVISLTPHLRWNHLSIEENYQMPLAYIVQGQLIEDSTNSIAWYICLNPDMTFRIKVVEDRNFKERLPQLGKC